VTFQRLDPLPEGVRVVREYRSLGCFLVECDHAVENVISIRGTGIRSDTMEYIESPFCRICRTVYPGEPVKMLAILPEAQPSLF
jgi:hypothetical protein